MSSSSCILVDLQFGDAGKGSICQKICHEYKADLVIRYNGGAQCGHNVVLPDGTHHTFSQWGSGTLCGVNTYLGPQVIIDLPAMKKEAEHLRSLPLNLSPFKMLSVNENCLVTSRLHTNMNRLKESVMGDERHGSCGRGQGEVRRYWLKYGEDAIIARDMSSISRLHSKLNLLRTRYLHEIEDMKIEDDNEYFHRIYQYSPYNEAGGFYDVGRQIQLLEDTPHFKMGIFEGAQGILLDEWYGFHPYTTWSDITTRPAWEMCQECDLVFTLGIIRAMTVRHGKGPLPTYDDELQYKMSDPHNHYNEWQGQLRFGHLDFPLLKYADKCIHSVDGIALNHLDLVSENEVRFATGYLHNKDKYILTSTKLPSLDRQRDRGVLLGQVQPVYQTGTRKDLIDKVNGICPVWIEGYGPTYEDKKMVRGNFFPLFD